MAEIKPENIPGIGKVQPIQPPVEGQTPPASSFQSIMESIPSPQNNEATQPSPMEVFPSKTPSGAEPTTSSLLEQTQAAQDQMNNVKNLLQDPLLNQNQNLLRYSQTQLLSQKMLDARSHIQGASGKLGTEQVPYAEVSEQSSPLTKFLSYVSDGEKQIGLAQNKLQTMATNKQMMNPADALLVQIKLSQAQQELEYSSILIGKLTDGIKTLLSIQL